MATIRLSSAGTGKSIEVPDSLTVAELREIADVSDDVKLAFNGEVVHNENDVVLNDGDTVVQAPKKISHG
jgi:sulfur carrier protein ThiS